MTSTLTAAPGPSLPLAGMRIVEISGYVAAPLAGMTLRQLGADVIRVEPIGGQADRSRWPMSSQGQSLYWAGLNKGKRAIAVDFRSTEGRQIIADLVTASGPHGGLVISNTSRFTDLSYEYLAQLRPDVIHVLLTGHRDGRTAVDYTVQAGVGLHDISGPAGTDGPVNQVLPAWDVACGLYLAVGLLAAERHRLLTGEGQSVKVALQDVAMATVGSLGYLAEAQLTPTPRGRDGNYVYGTFGRDFRTSDGVRLMIVVLTAAHWRALMVATGLEKAVAALEHALDTDFSDEHERYAYREVLAGLLRTWFESRDWAAADAALARSKLLYSRYRTFSDLAGDNSSALATDELFTRLDHPGIGPHWAPGSPLLMDGQQFPAMPSPAVGEDTDIVLVETLGWTIDEVADRRARGVVG